MALQTRNQLLKFGRHSCGAGNLACSRLSSRPYRATFCGSFSGGADFSLCSTTADPSSGGTDSSLCSTTADPSSGGTDFSLCSTTADPSSGGTDFSLCSTTAGSF